MSQRVKAAIVRFRPETVVLAAFLLVLAALRLAYGGPVTADKLTAKVPLVAMAAIAAGALVDRFGPARRSASAPGGLASRRWPSPARLASDWLPVILCFLVYENLHDVVKLIHQDTFDRQLAQIDAWMFGVQPTFWLQRIANPWLTDLLSMAYSSYFVTPTILGALLYAAGRTEEFRTFMLMMIATMYVGFLGYVLVPAIGPIFYFEGQYDPARLAGVFFHRGAEAIMNDYRSINRDCFPSLHTAISTLTLAWAWRTRKLHRLGRVVAWVYLPLMTALWFSTVYLRYHWVIDLVAGWFLTALVWVAVPRLARWWYAARDGQLARADVGPEVPQVSVG